MRDSMPGPGWWIASDGRWYPPELHPDLRAQASVVVEDPPSTNPSGDPPPALLDTAHLGSNGAATRPAAHSSNGSHADDHAVEVAAKPPGRPRQRLAIGVGLALATLALIIYIARGHDDRPSLESQLATNATTTPAQPTPSTSVVAGGAPGATGATGATSTTARAGAASPTSVASATPGTSGTSATSSPSAASVTSVTSAGRITPKVVSVFDLVKGNCLDGASLTDGLVTTIRVVDCSEVHTHEVYYSGRYPETAFDATKIANYANDTCLAQFSPYVGVDYTRSRYQYLHIVPTQESWTRDNDRDVVCVAFDEDATIVGSIAGRKQ